jgi:hypothetical protein
VKPSLHRYRPGEHGCAICGRNSTTHQPTQGENIMHQDTIRITSNTIKKCANCGDMLNLEAGKRGRKPRFCSSTCKNKMQTENRHLRNAARNNRTVSQREGMEALADLADRQEARAELLANPRSTWEQING